MNARTMAPEWHRKRAAPKAPKRKGPTPPPLRHRSTLLKGYSLSWSKHDIATLKLSAFWNDTAEEIAYMLGMDPDEVIAKANELGLRVARISDLTASRSLTARRPERTVAQGSPGGLE